MNFLLVFFIFLFFIMGIIFSKINIKVNTIDIKLNDYYKKITKVDDLDINISIYLFGLIKIIKINIYKNKLFINRIKFEINLSKFAENRKNNLKTIINNNKDLIKYGLKNLDVELKYSTTDSELTALIYPIICIIITNYISRTNDFMFNKIYVKPYFYNVNSFVLSISFVYKFYLFDLFNPKMHKKIAK